MGKVSRRSFLESAVSVAAAAHVFGPEASALATRDQMPLPWEQEISLREAAKTAFVEGILNPTDPTPNVLGLQQQSEHPLTLAITNPAIKASLWGPPHRITLSMIKTDVQDRRVKWPDHVLTLDEIKQGAFSPVNNDNIPAPTQKTRPVKGYLVETGGRSEPYLVNWHAYPFPCQKPVGQIILMLDDIESAPAPKLRQSCGSGLVRFELEHTTAHAEIEIVLSMTSNVFAVRAVGTGLKSPLKLRLYRHHDQAHLQYMSSDGKFRSGVPADISKPNSPAMEIDGRPAPFDYEADAAWNGPIDVPESGQDGRYFWIRQKMPAEKTFPEGFHYVMMGLIDRPVNVQLETADGKVGLGTPPPDESIRNAPGSAATAAFWSHGKSSTSYVVVISQIDAADYMAEAKKRLDDAEAQGFDGIVDGNTRWYGDLFDQRERGRVFYGEAHDVATEELAEVFSSWYCRHGGGCKTDMRRYQASAHYTTVETDSQRWHGYPCYNEWFYTPSYVRNRADTVDMWRQLVEHWWQASRDNAHQVFGLPGMAMLHGYLPPIKPDKYLHTNVAMELCVDTLAQVLKSLWDEWDYGGDREFLKFAYPMLRDMAMFYAAYVRRGEDGHYHLVPAMEAECWGIYPRFSHSIDSMGALCMSRWALLCTAEASELLGKDANLRTQWRAIAGEMAPYPTWTKPEGLIFAGVRDVEPFWSRGDHPFYEGVYPTTLADDLNLDSSAEEVEIMLRTVRLIQAAPNAEVLVLLGACPDSTANVQRQISQPIRGWTDLRSEINRNPERLVNSRSGRIHLFPCVPQRSVIAFRKFQARGGLLISAARNESGVYFLEIEGRRPVTCSLMNPWPGKRVTVRSEAKNQSVPFRMDTTNGECIVFTISPEDPHQIESA